MLTDGMNFLPTNERVQKGKELEDAIANCLTHHYKWTLEEASFHDDTKKKIDRFIIGKNDKRTPIQIKGRVSGDDILYDRYEPFFKSNGAIDERTKPGRDHVGKYEVYVCLSRDKKTIRAVTTEALRRVIKGMDEEWAACDYKLHFYSATYPGCEFRYHRDKYSGTPKVLAFLNVDIFESGKEITFYEMKWN